MEESSVETAERVVDELREQLAIGEDAETAIAVYKLANWLIGQLEIVKGLALELAERDLDSRELHAIKTQIGSAGWTEPIVKQLNEEAWSTALAQDPHLVEMLRRFEAARAALEEAQRPFTRLPRSRFFIR